MIPKNLYFMWDQPRDRWPPVVSFCVDLWTELHPSWSVRVLDAAEARDLVKDDVDLDIFEGMPVQAKSDIVRTILLASNGGIWADATVFPHFPVDTWIGKFSDKALAAYPTGMPGRVISSWFLIAPAHSELMVAQRRAVSAYWKTSKLKLPQDPRSIALIESNWREYVSDYAAHYLRVMPYFWWHYLFSIQMERDPALRGLFTADSLISTTGGAAFVLDRLGANAGNNRPLDKQIEHFLSTTDVKVSKLHHHRTDIDYPLEEIRRVVINRK